MNHPRLVTFAARPGFYVAIIALVIASTPARGAILYSQRSLWSTTGGPGNLSQAGTQVEFDDFALTRTGAIANVTWDGEDVSNNAVIPGPFNVGFYAAEGRRFGDLLASEVVSTNAQRTIPLDGNHYRCSADLSTPFVALAGVPYWLSIENDAPDRYWIWDFSLDGDRLSYAVSGGVPFEYQSDFAFALSDTKASAIPEPGSLPLLLSSVPSLLLFLRKSRGSRRP